MALRWAQFVQSITSRRMRRTCEIDKVPATEQPSSSAAPLVFESLEPRLLLAADPLGISEGYAVIQTDMATSLAATAGAPDATFAAAAVDAAPTVALTAPAANATVRGTVTVSASASDDVGVAGVQFLLDAAALGAEDTTSPYSLSWNTATAANGTHILSARARAMRPATRQTQRSPSPSTTRLPPERCSSMEVPPPPITAR